MDATTSSARHSAKALWKFLCTCKSVFVRMWKRHRRDVHILSGHIAVKTCSIVVNPNKFRPFFAPFPEVLFMHLTTSNTNNTNNTNDTKLKLKFGTKRFRAEVVWNVSSDCSQKFQKALSTLSRFKAAIKPDVLYSFGLQASEEYCEITTSATCHFYKLHYNS